MVRKIVEKVSQKRLISDLQRYRKEAIKFGATDAKIIKSSEVIIDERAYAKCIYPKCRFFGTSANCPPYSIKPEEIRRIIKRYRYGIIFTSEAPSEMFVGPFEALAKRKDANAHRRKIYEITSKLESLAFYDGYYFAMGFGAGPCKSAFCEKLECQALKPGNSCRFPLKARSSMEGVGMDVFGMAARMGWDIYPCGAGVSPEDVPLGRRIGIVFIY